MNPAKIIYAIYASEDIELVLRLLHHLGPLEEHHNATIWHDDPIEPGQVWKPQDEARLDQADVIVLMVSHAFMYSEFINQLEFKKIIDRHKAGTAKVIPVVLNACPWDIEFKSNDYDFSFKELAVFPEDLQPLSENKAPDQVFNQVMAHVRQFIAPTAAPVEPITSIEAQPQEISESSAQEQLALLFAEESAAAKKVEEEKKIKETEAKKRAEDEISAKNEPEAKQKADEEIKQKQEAEAKLKNEEAARIKEEFEAKRKIEEETKQRQEAEAKRINEAAAAQKRAAEAKHKQREEEESRRRKEAGTKQRAEEENKARAEKAKRQAEFAASVKQTSETRAVDIDEETAQKSSKKKLVLFGVGLAILVLAGIFLSKNSKGTEEDVQPIHNSTTVTESDSEAPVEKQPEVIEPTKTVVEETKASLSELRVGDRYEGGIVFSKDAGSKTVKIAQLKDAGPMTWKQAMKIHEKLGEGWRVPKIEELQLMQKTIGQGAKNSGKFADELYWSATPYDANQARLVRFRDGNTSFHYNSRGTHRRFRVRAIKDVE